MMTDNRIFKALVAEEVAEGKFAQTIKEKNITELPEGELVIEVHYSSLNFKDAASAFGLYEVSEEYPHTPGIDASGVVIADSSGTFSAGDKVVVFGYDLGMNTAGGFGQCIRIPANWAVACPETLTLKEAMIYGTAGVTAALCVEKLRANGAKPEDGNVAVTGASGGVGSIAVSLLNQLGFKVTAFTGKADQADHLKSLGADEVLDRNVINEIGESPIGEPRWAHAVDSLGGDYLFNLIKQIKPGGGVAACGLAGGVEFSGNVFPFITRGVALLGVDSVRIPLAEKQHIWQQVANDFKLPNLDELSQEVSLAEVPEFLQKILDGTSLGRYVVNVKDA